MKKNSKQSWEAEYAKKRLMTGDKPPTSLLRWLRWLEKKAPQTIDISEGCAMLDLGSGEGKNALHCASLGAKVQGLELATNAVATAQAKAKQRGLEKQAHFSQGSMGEPFPYRDASFDCIMDVTSSNSLSESERAVYLKESKRVLKPGGYMFVRALCKDGDANAKRLLVDHPGEEHDTYVIPEWGQTERVFSEQDMRALYEQYFDILLLDKETHYTTFNNRRYKRRFWIMYLQKTTG